MQRQEITAILASAGLRPQHKFGQNFMVDENVLAAIADAGEIAPADVVLEVGPGVGNLTRLLAQRAAAVLAVDIDASLMAAASRHHRALTNVTWLQADVLAGKHAINPDVIAALRSLAQAHPGGALRLVSNLPYNAASPLIAELLVLMRQELAKGNASVPLLFRRMAFTVQYEVAERMAAAPHTRDYGPLGILIQLMAQVRIVRKIPPGAFWPPPDVTSALVAVDPVPDRIARLPEATCLQRLLSGVFAHRRQTLQNALRHYLDERYTPALAQAIQTAGIDLSARPENLAPSQFLQLAEHVGVC